MFYAYGSIPCLSKTWTLASGRVCLEQTVMQSMKRDLCSGAVLLLCLPPGYPAAMGCQPCHPHLALSGALLPAVMGAFPSEMLLALLYK